MSDLKRQAEEWWEKHKDANPPSGQAQLYYKDNRQYALIGFLAGAQSQAAEIERLKAEANRNGYRNGYDDAVEDDRKGVAETVSKAFKECDQLRAEIEACRKKLDEQLEFRSSRIDQIRRFADQAERYRKALETIENECSCDTPEVCYDVAKEALSPDGRPSEMQEAVEGMAVALERIADDHGHAGEAKWAVAAYRKAQGGE